MKWVFTEREGRLVPLFLALSNLNNDSAINLLFCGNATQMYCAVVHSLDGKLCSLLHSFISSFVLSFPTHDFYWILYLIQFILFYIHFYFLFLLGFFFFFNPFQIVLFRISQIIEFTWKMLVFCYWDTFRNHDYIQVSFHTGSSWVGGHKIVGYFSFLHCSLVSSFLFLFIYFFWICMSASGCGWVEIRKCLMWK